MKGVIIEIDREEFSSIVSQAVHHALSNAGINPSPQSSKEDEDIMTVAEVCVLLNMKKSGLYQKTHQRQIPFMKQGKKLYFSRQEINEWLKSGGVMTLEQEKTEDDKIFYQKHKKRLDKITIKKTISFLQVKTITVLYPFGSFGVKRFYSRFLTFTTCKIFSLIFQGGRNCFLEENNYNHAKYLSSSRSLNLLRKVSIINEKVKGREEFVYEVILGNEIFNDYP